MNQLLSIAATADLIRTGAALSLAGPEGALDALPPGNWIAGTIPYFMASAGGVVSTEGQVFVTSLPPQGTVTLAHYGADALKGIVANGPDNGFSVAIVPAGSAAHKRFAEEAVNDADAFLKPTVGWVAGVHLSDLGSITPKVYDGRTGQKYADGVVVAHVALPESQLASIEIVNIRERLASYPTEGVSFSCNCILNFLFGELEGQSIGALQGPVTFGEIGYQLLNQTLVVLRIE